nr:Chain C, Spike protein S1 [Severe acute respiratory syndrome coronavirus 2]7N1A_C Chain C, Spike protein S1 [Severe acute respiratory syndrome coronavirus 2]7N1A_F Chain F, Spike protein S1 [Severe acute respiratory syndrome coronavirus 2]7N1F_C Chain C, Spike protein S1 [Severe acute respiratory syndrome coronavirus 2]7N6D_C Chain C, Spike protein S1 [Severe acute respiratory syndrome coronavirus 2]7N6D_G Chain G, Spike protein S1 [Severe acute respiratory syndrome coronavirus 2]7N6D_K Ch
YLQPRTFLL